MGSAVSIERELDTLQSPEASKVVPHLLEHQDELSKAAEVAETEGSTSLLHELLAKCGMNDQSKRETAIQEYLNRKKYIPNPINTDDVEIPDHLFALTEKLSENAHEEWAAQRINKGWVYGPERNDALKHHPCLIPYDDLTEDEKEYDRITSMKTLKLLLSLGYKLVPPEK